MSVDRDAQYGQALAKVDVFIADRSEYTRENVVQPSQGFTNQVIFARRNADLVVFKVFCQEERKARECFALRHWHHTDFVPKVIWDDDPSMAIMSFIPGNFLGHFEASESVVEGVCFEAGRAFGALAQVPWTPADQAHFELPIYGDRSKRLEDEVRGLMTRARVFENPKFQDAFWQDSIAFIESQLDALFAQPRFLCHGDAGHIHVDGDRFTGIYDVEMCFSGCEAMQLAYVLNALYGYFSEGENRWPSFCQGWGSVANKSFSLEDLRVAVAAHQWRCWGQIIGYATPPNPIRYRNRMETVVQLLLGSV